LEVRLGHDGALGDGSKLKTECAIITSAYGDLDCHGDNGSIKQELWHLLRVARNECSRKCQRHIFL